MNLLNTIEINEIANAMAEVAVAYFPCDYECMFEAFKNKLIELQKVKE